MDVDDDEQEDEIIILEPPPKFEPRAILPTPEATPKPTHLAVHHISDDEDEEMKPPFHSEVNLAPEKNNSTRVKKKRARTPVKMEEAAIVEGEEVPLPAEDTPLLADETEVAWEAEMEKQRRSPTVYDIVDLGAMEVRITHYMRSHTILRYIRPNTTACYMHPNTIAACVAPYFTTCVPTLYFATCVPTPRLVIRVPTPY